MKQRDVERLQREFEESGRNFTLDFQPISMGTLFSQFEGIYVPLQREVKAIKAGTMTPHQIRSIRLKERFDTMFTIIRIMEDFAYNDRRFGNCKSLYNQTIDLVKTRNPSFSMYQVK